MSLVGAISGQRSSRHQIQFIAVAEKNTTSTFTHQSVTASHIRQHTCKHSHRSVLCEADNHRSG